MQYREDKYGNPLSVLGFGCLRFPQKAGKIDLEETEREIMEAYRSGVNYFDTAYIYTGSEAALGQILEKNQIREKVHIATKLPHYLVKSLEDMEKMFREELKRLRTDYVDYYLMHMLNDTGAWQRLREMGIEQWIAEKKASGAIRQIGFSYHGNSETFCQVVDCYDWDFCQIQYNYLDEHSQAGRRGLYHAHAKGLPVVIMEPLRGGRLVNMLPEAAKKIMADFPVKRTPAQWAFRWLWNQKEVTVVLSGMNSMDMVRENVTSADQMQVGDMTVPEEEMLEQVVKAIYKDLKVGCTGCGYCMPCPKGVDIPGTFSAYNRRYAESWFSAMKEYFMCTALRKKSAAASNCVKCGKCEKHCPQNIPIWDKLQEATKVLENPVYRIAAKATRWFTKF